MHSDIRSLLNAVVTAQNHFQQAIEAHGTTLHLPGTDQSITGFLDIQDGMPVLHTHDPVTIQAGQELTTLDQRFICLGTDKADIVSTVHLLQVGTWIDVFEVRLSSHRIFGTALWQHVSVYRRVPTTSMTSKKTLSLWDAYEIEVGHVIKVGNDFFQVKKIDREGAVQTLTLEEYEQR
jgi:hypothetical protein